MDLADDMKLNPGKCKEIVACFSSLEDLPRALIIDGKSIERVKSHKTLGLIFQSNLKWNTFIDNTEKNN